MAEIKVICDREDIVAIADAVRSKTGTTNEMTLDGIVSNINKISTGDGIVLPTLTNEGSSSDMLSGKQLIDGDGNIVTGTIQTKTTDNVSVSGSTVTVPAGYYADNVIKSVTTVTRADTTISTTADDTNDKLTITASNNQGTGYVAGANKTATTTISLTVSGSTVTASDGSKSISKSVATATQATPSISIDNAGLITAIATQSAGYVTGGTKSATQQLTTQATKTVTPSTLPQTVIASGVYTTGAVTVDAIPSSYVQPSGTREITANGTFDVADKASVIVAVPNKEIALQDIEIIENGTYSPDDGYDGFGQVAVNVEGGGSAEPDYRDLYQRVEYIESAEDETYPYIITDFYGDNTSGLEVVASFPKLQDRIPMGSRQDSNATRFYCVYPMSASSVYYGFNTGSSISCALKVDTVYRLQTNFLNSRLICVYEEDGTRKANASLSATLTTQTAPVSIFGYNSASSGAISSKREYKLYSARCSKNHNVVRDYVPCYRKSDGVVGLYEKITGQFLTNSSTVGSFAKGSDIDW